MSTILGPGAGLIFMKVGTHAQESLAEIVSRKTQEIAAAGFAFWGYGGNTCHPQAMVQPFAQSYERRGSVIYLCMQKMDSRHFAVPLSADEYSADGREWLPVPQGVEVRGSRYALVVKDLRYEALELDLSATRVATGNSQGRRGNEYVRGRVDKACLELTEVGRAVAGSDDVVHVDLVAELISPYAVYVRNHP